MLVTIFNGIVKVRNFIKKHQIKINKKKVYKHIYLSKKEHIVFEVIIKYFTFRLIWKDNCVPYNNPKVFNSPEKAFV
jgi:hypothetical protein